MFDSMNSMQQDINDYKRQLKEKNVENEKLTKIVEKQKQKLEELKERSTEVDRMRENLDNIIKLQDVKLKIT